jgi:hypothetical protein
VPDLLVVRLCAIWELGIERTGYSMGTISARQ